MDKIIKFEFPDDDRVTLTPSLNIDPYGNLWLNLNGYPIVGISRDGVITMSNLTKKIRLKCSLPVNNLHENESYENHVNLDELFKREAKDNQ